jgi:hypothetical protein
MTRDSGARPLSASASPSDYAAPANAAFELGGAVASGGRMVGDIAVTEEKQENATLLASEESKLDDFIFEVQSDAVTGAIGQSKMVPNPAMPAGAGPRPGNMMPGPRETQQQHLQRYRAAIERRAAAQAARIGDRDVARRFRTAAQQKLRSVLPGIQTQLRTRYLDGHRATLQNQLVTRRRSLERQTFGSTMFNKIVDDSELLIRMRGIESNETQENIEKEVRQFRSDVVEDHVMREALIYSEMKTPDAAKQLQREVGNYASATSPYRDLLPERAQALQKKLSEQYRIDSRRLVADEERKEKADKKAIEDNSRDEVRRIQKAIQTARANGEAPKFTATQIRNNPRILGSDKKNQLVAELTGSDGVYNFDARFEYKKLIRDAITEDDLLDVERLIEADHDNNIIGNKLKLELDDDIDKRKTKTPEYEEEKRYEKVVKGALGISLFADQFVSPFTTDAKTVKRQLQLDKYKINLDDGMRPAEAAFAVIAEALQGNEEEAQSIANALPNSITGGMRTGNVLRKVTLADVATMRENWRALFRGQLPATIATDATQKELARQVALPETDERRITRDQRLKARELYAIESRINAVEDLLTPPPPPPSATTPPGGNGDGDADTESGVMEFFKDLFGSQQRAPGTSANR